MEQTLGKRIAENRKRLRLTQDQLAEKLGITAQAVSKWENDQSCPDISMLPKLAEIFGITTDALLGRDAPEPVHTAEVVGEDDDSNGIHLKGNRWEMHWDSGRRNAIGFAFWVLLLGILLLVDNLLDLGAGFWSLAWPSFLLMMGLFGGKRFSFTQLGFVLLGGYFLVDNLGFMPFQLGGEIIWPAMVILFGLSLLVDALRKKKKPSFRVIHKGNNGETHKGSPSDSCEIGEDTFDCSLSFGNGSHLIHLPVLRSGDISCSFGELTVDLSGCTAVAQDCSLDASCSFGELILLVPSRFRVELNSGTTFGDIHVSGEPDDAVAGTIYLDANASFGEIHIRYI